jgi:exonuclease VII small subunit
LEGQDRVDQLRAHVEEYHQHIMKLGDAREQWKVVEAQRKADEELQAAADYVVQCAKEEKAKQGGDPIIHSSPPSASIGSSGGQEFADLD